MELTYETVARLGVTSSLIICMATFIAVLIYTFGIASRDKLEAAQRSALDLGPETKVNGGRS
jgi:cbb3-type cytochrome oxidase subunit 3